jgi:hypothetical protein
LVFCPCARAPIQTFRTAPADAQLVESAELIVVGRLKPESVAFVPHGPAASAASWEYHATLVIAETLKGQAPSREITIVIHYGYNVYVDGKLTTPSGTSDGHASRPNYSWGKVEIICIDPGRANPLRLVKDAADDNIWFLSKVAHTQIGDLRSDDLFGIGQRDQLQSIALKNYFAAYLAPDPEAAVRKQMEIDPVAAVRGRPFLDFCDIKRILKNPDPVARANGLFLYYCRDYPNPIVEEGLTACGDAAVPLLASLLDDRRHHDQVLDLWRKTKPPACVPFLIDFLKKRDTFRDTQDLKPGWHSYQPRSRVADARFTVESQTSEAVGILGLIADPRAKDVLELTRRRWQSLNVPVEPNGPHVLQVCDWALNQIADRVSNPPSP